jgi:hypothetical protein
MEYTTGAGQLIHLKAEIVCYFITQNAVGSSQLAIPS